MKDIPLIFRLLFGLRWWLLGCLLFIFIVGTFVWCGKLGIIPGSLHSHDFYFALFGSVIQGLTGLTGFLAAMAVFQIQSLEGKLQTLANSTDKSEFVKNLDAHRKTIDKKEVVDKECYVVVMVQREVRLPKVVLEEMHYVYDFEWEVRDKTTQFVFLALLGVIVAIFSLVFSRYLIQYITLGHVAVVAVVYLSVISVWKAFWLVRRVVGLSHRSE